MLSSYLAILLINVIVCASATPALLTRNFGSLTGRCGASSGYNCIGSAFGPCCSRYGYCGSTDAYCADGCDLAYGQCNDAGKTSEGASSADTASKTSASSSKLVSSTKHGSSLTADATSSRPVLSESTLATSSSTSTVSVASDSSATSITNGLNSPTPIGDSKPSSISTSMLANATCQASTRNTTRHGLSLLLPVGGGCTLKENIECYALPYGGVGFASHIITYYTIFMISFGLSPWTWRVMDSYKLDFVLATLGLIITIIISILTIVRCRGSWEFSAIATWKMTLSMVLGMMALYLATEIRLTTEIRKWLKTRRLGYPVELKRSWYVWLTLYGLGLIVGLAGLFSLVKMAWSTIPAVRYITYAFVSLVGCYALSPSIITPILYYRYDRELDVIWECSAAAVILIVLTGALYSDWILGAIAGNLAGTPSSDNTVLYWTYFAAKRLPLFSL